MNTIILKKYFLNFSYALEAFVIALLLTLLKFLPFKYRILFGGKFFRFVISPFLGNKKRIENNLMLVMPKLTKNEKKKLIKKCLNNIGMTTFELLSPSGFKLAGQNATIKGPGVEILENAKSNSQPVILVSGHFGNYDVVRANLLAKGYEIGALYRPMSNPFFNATYLKNIAQIGLPLFARGSSGMSEMIKYLRSGKFIALLIDQHMANGEPLKFFGKTAYTATSAAKMALKYDALLVPFFVIRKEQKSSFDLYLEMPIKNSDPNTMTQEFNNLLEQRVRNNPEQWLWTHRRWKKE